MLRDLVFARNNHWVLRLYSVNRCNFCIFRWSLTDNCLEAFDEVCLVEKPQIYGHPRPIHNFAIGQSFGHFVKSIALNYPLRTDSDILTEEPLQRSFIEIEPAHHVIHPGDFSMSDDIVNNLVNLPHMLILLWKPLAQEIFRNLLHLSCILS